MKRVVRPIGSAIAVLAVGGLAACQSTMLSDDRVASNTAGVLGVSPDDLTISNRRSDGATNTYYVAKTRSGREYACTINGGGLLAMGMVKSAHLRAARPAVAHSIQFSGGTEMAATLGLAASRLRAIKGRPTIAAALAAVGDIDLSMVKLKLMDPEEGKGWDQAFADLAEERYRRFLTLLYLHRDGSIVPTQDIDAFWHQHILDTRAYAADCERVFGEFVHHFPYFGMRGEADAQNLLASFEITKAIYAEAFGEPYCLDGLGEAAGKCVKCGSGPVKCHHQPTRCR